MTPLATRLRELHDRRAAVKTRKPQGNGGLLLVSFRDCEAVLALLDAAKAKRLSPNHTPLCRCVTCENFDAAIAGLEK